MENKQHQHSHHQQGSSWSFARGLILLSIFVIIGYYLITEHRAHVAGFFANFPWWILLFLLCPLMHFFHGGHGSHGQQDEKHDHKNDDEQKGRRE